LSYDWGDVRQEIELSKLEHPNWKQSYKYRHADALRKLSPRDYLRQQPTDPLYNYSQITDNLENGEKDVKFSSNIDDILFIEQLLNFLEVKEKAIIVKHFLEGKTQQEIADEYNCDCSRINQLVKQALRKLKKYANS
jgi:RNA polymerase sigma factor (sigma-70 family)